MDVQAWRDELKQIITSNEYAYAAGASCSMGNKAQSEKDLLRRVDVLRALIREHSE